MRYLFLGLDILGLVLSGGVTASMKLLIGGAKTEAGVLKSVGRETLESMAQSAGKAPGMLTRAAEWLSTKFPAGSTFIKGILGFVDSIISNLLRILRKILSPKPMISGTLTSGLLYTGEKAVEKFMPKPTGEISTDDLMSGDAEYTP